MLFKILYTIFVLFICIVIYLKIKDNAHSLGFTIVTGIIATIIGNLLIPSDISLFDILKNIKDESGETENFFPEVTLNLKSLDLINTDEYDLTATIFPENCDIKWNSNNENIVTVDDNGHLKAVADGNAIITASITYKDVEYSDTCNVSVKNPFISLDSPQLLYIGETKNISAVTIPENIKISWSSSNSNIVTVNDNGKIEGISEGTAIITATMVYNNIDYSVNHNITIKAQLDEYGDNSEVDQNNDLQKSESNTISIRDVAWLDDEKIYKDDYATTMRGEEWSDCIRFGSSNINSDGTSVLRVVCDQKYSKFTAEIAPQEGFDKTETVPFYIYGGTGDVQTFKEEYQIDYSTKSFKVEIDLTNTDELYFWKSGNYNQGRIAGQFINGYTGMGILMHDAFLYE